MKRTLVVLAFLGAALFGGGLLYTQNSAPRVGYVGAQGLPTFPSPGATDYVRLVSGAVSGFGLINQVLTPSRVGCATTSDCTFSGTGTIQIISPNGVQPNGSANGFAPDVRPSSGVTKQLIIVPFSGTAATGAGTAATFPNGVTFTSTSTYWCSANANAISAYIELAHTSTTQITAISNTGSPAYDAICIGW